MLAKCAKCAHVFPTDHYGQLTCPHCGSQLMLNDPNRPAQPPQPPAPAEPAAAGVPGEPGAPAPFAAEGTPAAPPPAGGEAPPPPAPGAAPVPPPLIAGPAAEPQDKSTPWEERQQRGWVPALVDTVRLSFMDPVGLFSRMRIDNWNGAVSYYWILAAFGGLVGTVWNAAFSTLSSGFRSPHLPDNPFAAWFTLPATIGAGIAQALLAPLGLFIGAGILHLFAMLFRVAHGGFNATLRSVGYAAGPQVLNAVPFCGSVVAWLWTLVLVVIGLWKTHRMPLGFAIAVVIAPGVLLACCTCGTFGLAGMLGFSALNHLMQAP